MIPNESHIVRLAFFTAFNVVMAFSFLDYFNERLEYLSQEAHIEASKERRVTPNDQPNDIDWKNGRNDNNRLVAIVLTDNRLELPFSNEHKSEFRNGW